MHGSRENATSKFRVDISTPSPLLYVFSMMTPQDLASSYCSHCFITSILNILIIDESSRRSASSCSWTSGSTADFAGIQHCTRTMNSRTIKYIKRLRARIPLSPRPTIPASKFPLARLSSWKSSLKIAHSKWGGVKTTRKFVRSILSRTKHFAGAAQRGAMKTGSRAISFPAVLITCWAVILTRKTPNKDLPGNNKSVISATNSASATLVAGVLSNTHVISCHLLWITCLLVSSFWESSSSLMEARDGSLESVSKTLSIRPHLISECTVPLNTTEESINRHATASENMHLTSITTH